MFGAFLVFVDDLSLEKCSGFFPIFLYGCFCFFFLALSCRSSLYIFLF